MNYNGMDDDEADDDSNNDDNENEDAYDDDGYGDETSSDSDDYLYDDNDDDMWSYVRRLQAIQPGWDRDAVRSANGFESDSNFTSRFGATHISSSQRVMISILLTNLFLFSRFIFILFSRTAPPTNFSK